ncbi:WLM-domain-containing protein [Gonapodya prolifera JEL478]|uniref:WLM-domain-containing protein n=1 Tax=Gonapodya prolifera (strain JEL478) TaxID=1344416 RepID=A0A139AEV0_GONPJ|nr:WLM-domain-containing protein [Gonapodya prolifera JEL478]|eukprot:KXS15307.1 WLM-domain-containing protein [Gonapodya prolifera JEL478]
MELNIDHEDGEAPISVTISYAGNPMKLDLRPSLRLASLAERIEQETHIPIDGQKLLLKGKVLVGKGADVNKTLADVGVREGDKMMLIGTPAPAIASLHAHESRIARTLAARSALSLRPGARPFRPNSTPATITSLTSTSGFGTLEVLPQFPNRDEAREVVERLSNDGAVKAVMERHGWRVGRLIELSPAERTILGYNQNRGHVIALRLRTSDLSGFRHYPTIRRVLLHELSHMVHDEHDVQFHTLNSKLNKEVAEWERKEGKGRTLEALGGKVWEDYREGEEEGVDGGGLQGGAFVLGGTAAPVLTREELRNRAAQSATARATAANTGTGGDSRVGDEKEASHAQEKQTGPGAGESAREG